MKGCGPVHGTQRRYFSLEACRFRQIFSDDVLLLRVLRTCNNSLCATWVLRTVCKPCTTLQTHLVTENPLAGVSR